MLRVSATGTERLIYLLIATSVVVWGVSILLDAMDLTLRPLEHMLGFYPAGFLMSRQPWGILTYPWIHRDVAHLMINMILLYYVGQAYERRYGVGSLVTLFVLGTWSGAICYSLGYQLLGAVGVFVTPLALVGSSAGVYALAWGVAFAQPRGRIEMLGRISLRLAVALLLGIDLILSIGNIGGQLAHTGGALLGLYWGIKMHRTRRDITAPIRAAVQRRCEKLCSRKPGAPPEDSEGEIHYETVIDKLRRSGYGSLSSQERRCLRQTSQHLAQHTEPDEQQP